MSKMINKSLHAIIIVLLSIMIVISFVPFNSTSLALDVSSASIADNYEFVQSTQSDSEFVKKDVLTGEIEYYNLYNNETLVSIDNETQENSLSYIEKNNGGFIPEGVSISDSGMILQSIFGSDERTRINPTTSYPHSAVCFIKMTFPDGSVFRGTAWMYWNNIAITAGHCVYNEECGGWATSIQVIPGANETTTNAIVAPFGSAMAINFWTSQAFINNQDTDYDYGVLVLDSDIGYSTGWFGTHTQGSSLVGETVTITGYPGEYTRQMWEMSGKIKTNSSYLLRYEIDTTSGQSGSPIYRYSSTYGYQCLGIHTTGGGSYLIIFFKRNHGTRITSSLYDFFASFRT
ncbi:MAG: trypsin-like peptidase domain-containing protein [Clostridiales bacterium]|nr:trypsin-like peptidase domain-containing protein [Clostridiales bacterium]